MSDYRCVYVKGGIFFFTIVTYNRKPLFGNPGNVERLKQSFRYALQRRPFSIDAIVLLPDHLHCILSLSEDDHDYSVRWQLVKSYFSRGCEARIKTDGSKEIWQPRFWEHLVQDEADFSNHLDYIR